MVGTGTWSRPTCGRLETFFQRLIDICQSWLSVLYAACIRIGILSNHDNDGAIL